MSLKPGGAADKARLVGNDGSSLGFLDIAQSWLFRSHVSARLLDPGRGVDWSFDVLLHASPFSLGAVFRSAVERNRHDLARANHPIRSAPTTSPSLASPAPMRFLRGMLHRKNWSVELLESSPFGDGRATTSPILSAPGTLRADPFAIEVDGREWLLFEEMTRGDRGRLRAAVRDGSQWIPAEGEILSLPCHLSWPNVFRHDDRVFMVPETSETGEVQLWESVRFPTLWERRATLLSGRPWHDATLLHREGLWWMFVSSGGSHPKDHSAKLDIFWSDDLLGSPFRPHSGNPISTSVVGARPAGAFIEHEGMLLRPGQDCRGGYGSAVILHEVLELGMSTYRERIVSRIDPPSGACGIHTINRLPSGGWIVDVLR